MKKHIIIVILIAISIAISITGCSMLSSPKYLMADIQKLAIDGLDVSEIKEVQINEESSYTHGVSYRTLRYYDKILQNIDSIMGAGNYIIADIYSTNLMFGSSYCVWVIENDDLEEYQKLIAEGGHKNDFSRAYLFTYDDGTIESNYNSHLISELYRSEIEAAFSEACSIEACLFVEYCVAEYTSYEKEYESVDAFQQEYKYEDGNVNSVNILVPTDITKDEIELMCNDITEVMNTYNVWLIELCILEAEETLDDYLNVESINKFKFNRTATISYDQNKKLEAINYDDSGL